MKREVRVGLYTLLIAAAAALLSIFTTASSYTPKNTPSRTPTSTEYRRTSIPTSTRTQTPTATLGLSVYGLHEDEACFLIKKFEDLNANGLWDEGEPTVPGYPFRISYPVHPLPSNLLPWSHYQPQRIPQLTSTEDSSRYLSIVLTPPFGVTEEERTNEAGWIQICGPLGEYWVEELDIPGWRAITPRRQSIVLKAGEYLQELFFGNRQVPNTPYPTNTRPPSTHTREPSDTPRPPTETPEPTKVGDDL